MQESSKNLPDSETYSTICAAFSNFGTVKDKIDALYTSFLIFGTFEEKIDALKEIEKESSRPTMDNFLIGAIILQLPCQLCTKSSPRSRKIEKAYAAARTIAELVRKAPHLAKKFLEFSTATSHDSWQSSSSSVVRYLAVLMYNDIAGIDERVIAARALANLACHPDHLNRIATMPGVITGFSALLNDRIANAVQKGVVVGAFANLATNPENRARIANQKGVITGLSALLKDSSPNVQKKVADALNCLAMHHASAVIIAGTEGIIEGLSALLNSRIANFIQKIAAARALANLALQPENKSIIATTKEVIEGLSNVNGNIKSNLATLDRLQKKGNYQRENFMCTERSQVLVKLSQDLAILLPVLRAAVSATPKRDKEAPSVAATPAHFPQEHASIFSKLREKRKRTASRDEAYPKRMNKDR